MAHYLLKGLITQHSNSEYLPLARVLLQLGARALPGWQDTVLALNAMAASASGSLGSSGGQAAVGHSSRAGVLTEVQQLMFTQLHLHLEELLELEARLLTTTSSGEAGGREAGSSEPGSGPDLAELLAPDSQLRRMQSSLWRWHLGCCPQLQQLPARLSAGITPATIGAACQAWASSLAGGTPPPAAPGSSDGDAAAVGVRGMVPLLDHRRAVLVGAGLGSCLAMGEAALAQVLKGSGIGLAAPLVRAELVQQCPLLLAALGVPYVEHRAVLSWECNRCVRGQGRWHVLHAPAVCGATRQVSL